MATVAAPPRVSAIVPSYNGGAKLERCLDALDASPIVDEVIVLDGGSTDGTDERVEHRPRVRMVRMPGTHVSHRLDEGVKMAQHDLVLLLDDDAFVDPETPLRMAEVLLERDEVGVVGARLRYEDGRDQRSAWRYKTLGSAFIDVLGLQRIARRFRPPAVRPEPHTGLVHASWLPLCAALLRREAFEQIGGFDARFRFYKDDHDFALRMTRAGWKTVVRNDAGAIHLRHATSGSKRGPYFVQFHRSQLEYLRKHYPRGWRAYAAVWAVRAWLHVLGWGGRAAYCRLRSDEQGERDAREWVTTFKACGRTATGAAVLPAQVSPIASRS
jgi:GT2 family glycosyltransferase